MLYDLGLCLLWGCKLNGSGGQKHKIEDSNIKEGAKWGQRMTVEVSAPDKGIKLITELK